MNALLLVRRSLVHYGRTNAAVVLGVAVAVATLAGALLVGDSVRASLRQLAVARLGAADHIVSATTLFTDGLADRLASAPPLRAQWHGAVPVLALEGTLTHEQSGSRAGRVQVFGVDDRFWRFQRVEGLATGSDRSAFLGESLARELGATEGDALLLRVQRPSTIPAGTIQGRRDEAGRAVRLRLGGVLTRAEGGEFSPRPHQGAARTVFVALARLQRDLDLPHRANLLLFASRHPASDPAVLIEEVTKQADLADLGVRLRPVAGPALAVESDAGLLTERLAEGAAAAAREAGVEPIPVLTYLATSIRANGRETPYSLISALPAHVVAGAADGTSADAPGPCKPAGGDVVTSSEASPHCAPIWLSQWTAHDLGVTPGARVDLEFYLWSDDEGLVTRGAGFTLAGILPMAGLAVDPDLTPEYPGVSTTANIAEWEPPFPVDLRRIRPKDEDYWDRHLTSPKAFVRLQDGQALWASRYGRVTSLRVPAGERTPADLHAVYRAALERHIDARLAGFTVTPVRDQALAAAEGTTDFGEYFTYFSFFLIAAALLLAVLFFRLGAESRAREIGLLASFGYTPQAVRRLMLAEGLVLALLGSIAGAFAAIVYAAAIMYALRTWWLDAVGTTDLKLHVTAAPLVTGAVAGLLAAAACIVWTLRTLRLSSERSLISGAWAERESSGTGGDGRKRQWAWWLATAALTLALAAGAGLVPATVGFFGSGTVLLGAGVSALGSWLRRTSRAPLTAERAPMLALGIRNARHRPSRSLLSVALIASATFMIVSVGAFRRGAGHETGPTSSTGGFALVGESIVPLMHDPATRPGAEALSLGPELEGIRVARFRLRPGDDASCLNLYRPGNPRLLGATSEFVRSGRFSFARSLAATDEERRNPWLLLERSFPDGAVPVIGDATSLAYAFHLEVGDDYLVSGPDGVPLRLRIVGALRNSVLQSELIMADAHFTRLFPRHEGFRLFLVEADPPREATVAAALERQLQDFGMDVQSTSARLASYHRVENTYITTFQSLGALGLVLGTFGVGTVMLRNVLERRRELALLRAAGYRRDHLVRMVLAETLFLVTCGLVLGAVSALVAIAPALAGRAQSLAVAPMGAVLGGVILAGLLSAALATRAVTRSPLLPALRNE